jgi:hypothetical protein
VKTWTFIIGMATTMAMAQAPQPEASQPAWAADWRATAFVRQGKHEEAGLERPGMMARFVREGDQLPGGIIVLDVKYDERQVVLGKGKETAVIQQEMTMMPAPIIKVPTAPVVSAPPVSKKPKIDKATAMRDENGRWVVAFPNGKNLDMQSYVDRYGGIAGAIQHVKELADRETNPERLEYRQQQLEALQQMAAGGNPPPPPKKSGPKKNRSVVF